jgi:hypothetical protein
MGAHARLLGGPDDDNGGVRKRLFWNFWPEVFFALLVLAILVPLFYWLYQLSKDSAKRPEYSVTVAGFSGLDPDRDLLAPGRATLDPTFDLTLRIKEPRKYMTACVESDSTATVSYRGAQLARGPVPGFCGRNGNTTEVRSVMAWGIAVAVPQFARDRLAEELRRGEAALDVTLASPARYCQTCDNRQTVIRCTPRLGHGEASPPCWVTTQFPILPDDPARRVRMPTFLATL